MVCMFDRHTNWANRLHVLHGSESSTLGLGHDSACDVPTCPGHELSQFSSHEYTLFPSLRSFVQGRVVREKHSSKQPSGSGGVAQESAPPRGKSLTRH